MTNDAPLRFCSRCVAASAGEDRLEVRRHGDRFTLVVADGAGGISGGALAARTAAAAMADAGAEPLDADAWCARLRALDRTLESDPRCGETTLVVIQITPREVWGASVGDSGALLVAPDRLIDLTATQRRKPLLGSGACIPAGIAEHPFSGRILLATDGLLKYLSPDRLRSITTGSDLPTTVDALIAAVTLPSGKLPDDIAVILGEMAL